jgi:menaquinol-cytochrome c reductase iron-sulfur subunit
MDFEYACSNGFRSRFRILSLGFAPLWEVFALDSSRRSLIGWTFGLWGVISGALGIKALGYILGGKKSSSQAEWIEVGDVSKLAPGIPHEMSFERVRGDAWRAVKEKGSVWVVKSDAGNVTVFAPGCTHLGCAFHYEEKKNQFLCPCHDSYFALDGKVLTGPAPRSLDKHLSRVVNDKLSIGPVRKG